MKYNVVSFLGLFVLIGVAWLFSRNRRAVNWRVVLWGVALQIGFGVCIFTVLAPLPPGKNPLIWLNNGVNALIESSMAGARFVFNRLALGPGQSNDTGETSLGFFLAFQALPTIIFFSALISIFYYYRIMPFVIKWFSRFFTRTMRISGAESVAATSNMFVGVEAALGVKPHLAAMTRSELCTLLTAGMATVASNVLAMYIMALGKTFPTIAAHLLSASLLSVPAAIVMSKLLMPETQNPETLGVAVDPHYDRESNVFEAVINGSWSGVRLIAGIVALLIAVLGLVALANLLLGAAGGWLNARLHWSVNWSLSGLAGYCMYPFMAIIGIEVADIPEIAGIVGMRLIETEVPAYFSLSGLAKAGAISSRSMVVASYALCGFAHLASMAIFVGGVSTLVPARTRTISRVAFRALAAATLACLMTACIAGTFFHESSILFGK